MNLHTAFAQSVEHRADHPAVFWGDEIISYRQIESRARALAGKLCHQCGVKPGDRVAIWVRNCPEFPALLFGAWMAGAVVVMVNHFLKPDEVAYIVKDSGAKLVVSETGLAEAQAKLAALVPGLRVLQREELPLSPDTTGFAAAQQTEVDLAALLYTSGTTGHPKGAMLTHGNFLSNVRSCLQCLEVTERDRLVVLLPQFHSFMFTVGTLVPMLAGAAVIVLKSLHPLKHVLEEIFHHGGTILPAVPQLWRMIASMPAPAHWPLRLCISGGAPLPVEVLREFNGKFPVSLIEGYGPTESSPVATVNPLHGVQKPGSVGIPIPGVELSIRDDAGGELPIGATGEICIRGPNVMRGYWQQPAETAAVLRDGWLYTGDLGHRDADNYYFITDRTKDMLLVNGINVYPREVEEVIYQFPGVKEAAVIGVKDARKGEAPVAFVALSEGATLAEADLIKFLREKLADYKVPKKVRVLPALPRNATGKILKTSLRQLADAEGQ